MGEESLMGGEVNLVFRLEKLAGSLGEPCCVSETAHDEARWTGWNTFAWRIRVERL